MNIAMGKDGSIRLENNQLILERLKAYSHPVLQAIFWVMEANDSSHNHNGAANVEGPLTSGVTQTMIQLPWWTTKGA